MKKVEKNVLVLHSAKQMFDLVDKVEDYPNFLPWYSKTEVIERKDKELKARLFMDYMGVRQSFATHNHNIPGSEIRMDLLEGPFKTLRGTWKFIDLGGDMCKIEFAFYRHFPRIQPPFRYAGRRIRQRGRQTLCLKSKLFTERLKSRYYAQSALSKEQPQGQLCFKAAWIKIFLNWI